MRKSKKIKPNHDYNKLLRTIADNIRRIRLEKKLTQEEMSSFGFERRWFQRIESGSYSPSLPTLGKLSSALGDHIVEFFKEF